MKNSEKCKNEKKIRKSVKKDENTNDMDEEDNNMPK